jgi:hypothetical protein
VSETQGGLTRREALKRGVVVAGALWAVPVVQAVGMRPAYAQAPSPQCTTYCVRWNQGNWLGIPGANNVLDCPAGAVNDLPPCIDDFTVEGTKETGYTVTYPDSCKFEFGDPSVDDIDPFVVGIKCNSGRDHKIQLTATEYPLSIPPCAAGDSILYFELIIQCCCG